MLNMLKKNDVFGEISLVEHTRRTATARSFEPSLLLSITKHKFDKLFEVFPDFRNIMVVRSGGSPATLSRSVVLQSGSTNPTFLLL